METKIGEAKGYLITYDSRDKLFHLKDGRDNEVGSGKTQDEVEQQADKLAKMAFPFPIPALIVGNLAIQLGRITSANIEDKSCIFVYTEKSAYSSRVKVHLRYSSVYEITLKNEAIRLQIVASLGKHKQLENEIESLKSQLEKPIDLDYFSFKPSY